jgi:CheY-like chemotaxis protein
VLVAEDDPASRLLLTTLLREVNVRVDAVEDGKAAVSDASLTPYDMIFMDMQMPELDGLAATRSIRKREGPCARTPVIGVTANVFAEDIERCTAAGMNDVLQKPVSEEALYRILGRLLGDAPNAGLAATRVREPQAAGIAGGAMAPRLRVMPVFLETTARLVADMQAAGAGGDTLQLARLAHRLKSSSLAIDATDLANVCRRIELAGVSDDIGAALSALEPLASAYVTTCDAVRTELAGHPA